MLTGFLLLILGIKIKMGTIKSLGCKVLVVVSMFCNFTCMFGFA